MTAIPRVNTDELTIADPAGTKLANRDVWVYLRGTLTPATIFAVDTLSDMTTLTQPLKSDLRGVVRAASGADAWITPGSYDVVVNGAPLFHWEPNSGRGGAPFGPASGDLGGNYPGPTVVAGGGGSGPPSGPAGGVLGGNYPNPGFAEDMATQAELDAVRQTVNKRATGSATSFTLADAGGIIDVGSTGDRIVTIPTDATLPGFPVGTVIEVCRIGNGANNATAVVIAGANPGMIESEAAGAIVDSVAVAVRYGSIFFRKRLAPDTWLAQGKIL